jgi:hypothetical protein
LQHARDLYLTVTYAEEISWTEDLRAGVEPLVKVVLEEIQGATGGSL